MGNLLKHLANSGLQRLTGDPIANQFFQKKANAYAGIKKQQFMRRYLDQKGECALCGDPLKLDTKQTHIDHIIPKAQGGLNEIDNLQLVCATCNYAKRDMSLKDFVLLCTKVQQVFYKTDVLPKDVVEQIVQQRWYRESHRGSSHHARCQDKKGQKKFEERRSKSRLHRRKFREAI